MAPPQNGAHLQQLVCALQWVRTGIPNFTTTIRLLQDCLERVYAAASGKRTRQAADRILLSSIGWSLAETMSFDACRKSLASQVTLAHRDEKKRLSIYTDASDFAWSGIATQVPLADLTLPAAEQRHEPLAFLSGRFNLTQLGWSTIEKEAFAAIATIERLHWIAATSAGFDLHTDHNNLVFLFDPLAVVPDMSQTTARKVLRWAVKLSLYNYVCIHVRGEDNVWADLLGRWTLPSVGVMLNVVRKRHIT